MLDPDEYLVITNATTTSDFWDLDDVTVVFLGSPITSSGLANIGDYVGLFDDSEELVDDVSYGTNEEAFSPSVPGVSEGNSIARIPVENDTDSADDWEESDPPTPGS
jgi:hypothetical protein